MRQHVLSRRGQLVCVGVGAALCVGPALAQQDRLSAALQVSQVKVSDAQASQKRVDQTAEKTRTAIDGYRRLLKLVDGLKKHNALQGRIIKNQEKRMRDLNQAILDVASVQQQMPGLTLRMLEALEEFIDRDVPLYIGERKERSAHLQANMERSDLSVAEKFRQVLEAYGIEINDYGRKISTYRDTVTVDGVEREVNILQVGRIALLYQTLDAEQSGVWNQGARRWDELDSSYRSAMRQALRIARKQSAINLLKLPIHAPTPVVADQGA